VFEFDADADLPAAARFALADDDSVSIPVDEAPPEARKNVMQTSSAQWHDDVTKAPLKVEVPVYRQPNETALLETMDSDDEAEAELFSTLEALEETLRAGAAAGESWLCGAEPSLADVVLFPTLIRLELVYAPLFGCSRRPLWQFPALAQWRARFFALPGVAATCFPEAWRRDYFGSLFPLNASGIIPAGPDLASLVVGPG
jgi:glutathionyl-hydroquinone reductase